MSEYDAKSPRAVFLSGFMGDGFNNRRVKEALADGGGYDDVEVFTLPEAYDQSRRLRTAAKDAEVYTHSAGAMYVKGLVGVEAVHLLAAPRPMPLQLPFALLPRMMRDTAQFKKQLAGDPELRELEAQKVAAVKENLSLGPQRIPWQLLQSFPMARFNRVKAAAEMDEEGIDAHVAAMSDDRFFPPSEKESERAKLLGVDYIVISGPHAEISRHPANVLRSYWERIRR